MLPIRLLLIVKVVPDVVTIPEKPWPIVLAGILIDPITLLLILVTVLEASQ